MRHLVGVQFCGAAVRVGERRSKRLCLLPPEHDGEHSAEFERRKLTREERLEREIAHLKAQRDHRQRHREALKRMVRERDAKIARIERQFGYRIHYKIAGGRNRVRRWVYQLGHARRIHSLKDWRW